VLHWSGTSWLPELVLLSFEIQVHLVYRSAWLSLLVLPNRSVPSLNHEEAVAGTVRFSAADYFAVAVYLASFLLNIMAAPVDAELALTFRRDPQFLERPLPGPINAQLQRWNIIQLLKCSTLLVGLLVVCLCLIKWALAILVIIGSGTSFSERMYSQLRIHLSFCSAAQERA
jgi:hypothetical protein